MKNRVWLTWILQLLVVVVVIWTTVWLVGVYRSTEDTQLSQARLFEPTVRVDELREVLLIRVKNEIQLADAVVDALENSVPIHFQMEYNLEKSRGWFGQRRLGADQHYITLRYNALLEQYVIERYLVSNPSLVAVEQYPDLNSAIEFLINAQTLALLLDNRIEQVDNPYQLNLRLSLDLDALPAPLRPYAFNRSGWVVDTGWQDWPVSLRAGDS